jgi:hypothetical protein
VTAPFPDSICHRCAHHRIVKSARSAFVLCSHPDLPKYPRQPVAACSGFAEAPP